MSSVFFCTPQEVLVWLTALQKELGGEVSDEKMRDYIWNTLKSGRVRRTTRTAKGEALGTAGGAAAAQSGMGILHRWCLVTDTPS